MTETRPPRAQRGKAEPDHIQWRILDNQVVPNQVGLGLIDEIRSYLEGLPNRQLAETLIGGLSTYDFPETHGGEMLKLVREAAGVTTCCRRCRTRSTPATRPAGSMAA